MNITRDQMMQRYKSLPTDLQDAVFSMENAQTLQNIGQIHKLRVDQIGVLADETGLVMLGFTKPNEFIPHLAERLKIDKELVRTIAHEINDRIFIKVREALRKIHGVKDNEIEEKAEINMETRPETPWKVSGTIKPQPVLATEEEVRNKEQRQFEAKSPAPEIFNPEPLPAPPSAGPTPQPAEPAPAKNIFSERMDEKGFRSPAEVVEKSSVDPYREPI